MAKMCHVEWIIMEHGEGLSEESRAELGVVLGTEHRLRGADS